MIQWKLLPLVLCVCLGCTVEHHYNPVIDEEPRAILYENSFLRQVSTTTEEVQTVDLSKVTSIPGSQRSFITLHMAGAFPEQDTMKTVLTALQAFEKKFNVKVVAGGWHIMWHPNTANGNNLI